MEHLVVEGGDSAALHGLVLILEPVFDIDLLLLLIGIADQLLHRRRLIEEDRRIGNDDQDNRDQQHAEDLLPDAAAHDFAVSSHGTLLAAKRVSFPSWKYCTGKSGGIQEIFLEAKRILPKAGGLPPPVFPAFSGASQKRKRDRCPAAMALPLILFFLRESSLGGFGMFPSLFVSNHHLCNNRR